MDWVLVYGRGLESLWNTIGESTSSGGSGWQ